MELNQSKSDRADSREIQSVVIVGGGTAGMLAALAIKRHRPELIVRMIRSTKIGVIGVGEGTIPSVVHFLHRFLGIAPFDLYAKAKASPKLGIRYLWGKRPFFHYTFSRQVAAPLPGLDMPRGYFCEDDFSFADRNAALMSYSNVCFRNPNGRPVYNNNFAYHLENKLFVQYLEQLTDEVGVEKIDAIVKHVQTSDQGIEKLVLDGPHQEIRADLFVDCSGFRALLIGQPGLNEPFDRFGDALFCDKAVIGGWSRTDEPYHSFTTAETMTAGWCWQIEHDDSLNRGYVFSSSFLSDDQATEEFLTANPHSESAHIIQFESGVRRRTWVKNVIAFGNAAGFVEPLEATSIGMICDGILRLVKSLQASANRNLTIQSEIYNRITYSNWSIIKDFLAVHYKFNERLDSPFWQAARADVELGQAQKYVDYYKRVGPDFSILSTELNRDFFGAEGYLVMLLGQNVPFDRPVQITNRQQEIWNAFRNRLGQSAKSGFNVRQFLEMTRSPDAYEFFQMRNPNQSGSKDQVEPVGGHFGELNWH